MTAIDPQRLYPFSEAAAFVPSCRKGKRLSPRTLHTWRKRGWLKAEARKRGGITYWFVSGAELLRLQAPQPPLVITTPAEIRRQHERDMKALRKRGLKV